MFYSDISEKIIKAFYNVYNELGNGFLEKVYEEALIIEMKELGLEIVRQKELTVNYKGNEICKYRVDLVVEEKIIVEIKAVKSLNKLHEAQLINYLAATGIKVGLVVNFGEKLEFKRMVFEKKNKK